MWLWRGRRKIRGDDIGRGRVLGADTTLVFTMRDAHGVYLPLAGYHVPKAILDPDYRIVLTTLPDYVVEGLTTGRAVVTDDVANDPRFKGSGLATLPRVPRSLVFTPVVSNGQARAGVVTLSWSERLPVTDEQRAILGAIGQQLGRGLDRARLAVESEGRRRAAVALSEISRRLAETHEAELVEGEIAATVRRLLEAAAVVMFRVDRETGTLVCVTFAGDLGPSLRPPYNLPPGVGVAGLAVRERRVVSTGDTLGDPAIVLTDELRRRLGGIRAALAVPLVMHDEVIGAVTVADRTGRIFSPEEVELVQAFAVQAVLAREQRRLRREVIVSAHEDERRRIAADFHDGVAELVVSARQHVENCEALWRRAPGKACLELSKAHDRLARAVDETRRVLKALRPTSLESAGWIAAIRELLADVGAERRWTVTLSENLGNARLDASVEIAAYRIVQEAVTNAARHAGAACLELAIRQDVEWLHLLVTDDGKGFPMADGLRRREPRARRRAGGWHHRLRAPSPSPATVVKRARHVKVVLVDDHAMVREGLRSMLSAASFDVVGEAATGAEALPTVERTQPDVALLDLQLPDEGGLTVLARLKSARPSLRVLILTMHDDPALARQAISAGAAGYLLKGASRAEVLAGIRAVANGESVLPTELLRSVVADSAAAARAGSALRAIELDVLRLGARGQTNKEISAALGCSVATVKKHLAGIFLKLGVADRTEAAVAAQREGLVP